MIDAPLPQERLQFLEQVLATSVAGIVVLGDDGRFHYANPRAESILGRSLTELQQQHFNPEHWRATDVQGRPVSAHRSEIRRALAAGETVFGVRRTITLPDGGERHLSLNAAPLFEASGVPDRMVIAINDITAQVEYERDLRWTRDALQASETRFRQLAENISEIVWIVEDGRFVFVNRAYEQISGRCRDVLYRNPLDFLEGVHPEDRDEVVQAMEVDLSDGGYLDLQYRALRPDGEVRWLHTRSFPVEDQPAMRVGLTSDVTEARLAEARMERLASVDPLTGCWNRLRGELVLDELFELAARHGRPFALALFDLDHFKRVNDRFGHQVGDQVLVALCERVQRSLRRNDTLVRWGGEEFLLCLPETPTAGAVELVERIRELIAEQPLADAGVVTVSFGVGEWRPGDDPKGLLARVDRALYVAKAGGRNRTEAA